LILITNFRKLSEISDLANPKFFINLQQQQCFRISTTKQPGKRDKLYDSLGICEKARKGAETFAQYWKE